MKNKVLKYFCAAALGGFPGAAVAGFAANSNAGGIGTTVNNNIMEETVNIRGIVVDSNGRGIRGAVVQSLTGKTWTRTSDEGTFGLKVPKNSRIRVNAGKWGCKEFITGSKTSYVVTFYEDTNFAYLKSIPHFDGKEVFKNYLKPLRVKIYNGMMYVNTSFTIPVEFMDSEKRIVMQPVVTRQGDNSCVRLRPLVFDGKDFGILQRRGHECGDVRELKYYSNYSVEVDDDNRFMTFHYSDSCRLNQADGTLKTYGLVKVTSFCGDEITDCARTTIGCSNPLQMFDFPSLASDLDNSHAPKQGKVKFEHQGSIKLNFRVDEYKIYMTDGNNAQELNSLRSTLAEIDKDPEKTLEAFSIYGYTSPEATYKYNKELSGKRMKSALDAIMDGAPKKKREGVRMKSDGFVTPWDSVSNAMRMAWKIAEADELDEVIRKCKGNHDCISSKVPRMGIYNEVKKFLPRFRKVLYKYEYSILRTLTDSEIREIYEKNPADLTPSELWRHFCAQGSMSFDREVAMLREMLGIYPDLMIAANRLAYLMIQNNTPDCNVLAGFMNQHVPVEVKINHILSLLMSNRTEEARVLADGLPLNTRTAALKSVIGCIYGNEAMAVKGLDQMNVYNRTVMMLALERNEDAYTLSKQITGTDPYSEYVKAMAANRMGYTDKAKAHLQKALRSNRELSRMAVMDADVSNLLRK